jgi:hypothetical protein
MWRLISLLILLLWCLMTTQLLQRYFVDSDEGQVVDLNEVISLAAIGKTSDNLLKVSSEGRSCGDAMIKIGQRGGRGGFSFESAGHVDSSVEHGLLGVTWQVTAGLEEGLKCDELSLRMRMAETDTSVLLEWREGLQSPELEVTRGKEVLMDSAGALRQLEWLGMLGGNDMLRGGTMGTGAEAMKVVATRCRYLLAGELRPGFAVRLNFMRLYKAEVLLSRAGEVIRISLPNGWKLENSLLHDLDKG